MTARTGAKPELRLADHRFFRGMDKAFVSRLNERAYVRSFDTGDLLLREGDAAEEFLAVFSGEVALELILPGRPRATIQTLGPGDVLGWSWLLYPHQWRLDARALQPTRSLGLGASHLRSVLDRSPADGYRFLRRLLPVIALRLDNTRRRLLGRSGG